MPCGPVWLLCLLIRSCTFHFIGRYIVLFVSSFWVEFELFYAKDVYCGRFVLFNLLSNWYYATTETDELRASTMLYLGFFCLLHSLWSMISLLIYSGSFLGEHHWSSCPQRKLGKVLLVHQWQLSSLHFWWGFVKFPIRLLFTATFDFFKWWTLSVALVLLMCYSIVHLCFPVWKCG